MMMCCVCMLNGLNGLSVCDWMLWEGCEGGMRVVVCEL